MVEANEKITDVGSKRGNHLEIKGSLYSEKEMTLDEFIDEFLKIVEDRGWTYCGTTDIVDPHESWDKVE